MMSLKLKAKRSKRGLSGAVTALILVIASVIIALVVVGFAFGLFGALGGTPTVTQVGTGSLSGSSSTGYQATFTLQSTGKVQIVSASIVGTTESAGSAAITGYSLTTGINTVTISFAPGTFTPQPGATYQISIGLSDGTTVQVAVTYVGS
ncbi:MAG: DUF973 family protein [Sulfolobaceae archaeon]